MVRKNSKMVTCRKCAEVIKPNASLCKHCGTHVQKINTSLILSYLPLVIGVLALFVSFNQWTVATERLEKTTDSMKLAEQAAIQSAEALNKLKLTELRIKNSQSIIAGDLATLMETRHFDLVHDFILYCTNERKNYECTGVINRGMIFYTHLKKNISDELKYGALEFSHYEELIDSMDDAQNRYEVCIASCNLEEDNKARLSRVVNYLNEAKTVIESSLTFK